MAEEKRKSKLTNPVALNYHILPGLNDGYLTSALAVVNETTDTSIQDYLDGIKITEGVSLNTLTTVGNYITASTDVTLGMSGLPLIDVLKTGKDGKEITVEQELRIDGLLSIQVIVMGTSIKQILYNTENNDVYLRTGIRLANGSYKFDKWSKLGNGESNVAPEVWDEDEFSYDKEKEKTT